MRPCHFFPRRGGVLGIGQLVVLKESEENNEENSIRELHVDPYQILQTYIIGIVWQMVTRITDEILGLKGLRSGIRE